MPFTLKKFKAIKDKKIQFFLEDDLGYSPKIAQKLIGKGRVFRSDMSAFNPSEIIDCDEISIGVFEGISRGLKPLLEFQDFAIFDKPTHLMVHPISKNTPYSLLDEIRYHFGENANLIHRIDAETSGLVIVGKNKKSEIELKDMFQEKKYHKSYLAIVCGKIDKELKIDKNIDKEGLLIGVKMKTCQKEEGGKESITIIKPIKYNKEKDLTLIEAIPLTGRQHQIRVHLHSIGHTILGDPIYGVDDVNAENYLNKTLSKEDRFKVTGSSRLWLHANYLEFIYKNITYKIYSKNEDLKNEFF
ncbi:RluA family pseudouridine synthase [Aliarcobacter cryaerophilus]|uniref:RluA family pseudouridine synthase n=1 Tax=Aliarcobacter cryaerophilus TaxID=28198 RepID=UPI0021B2C609|nr:RluA family pseudouridine synthase [Aliarcobacter cryaerophilus]MCT7433544.1 RluA family pseudouridine synthase [Aliarcobacter cryaerophilus]MCT7481323.1 RluA family pseudouridine synthase [Aliarcobacter cryaerophilus]MCT7523552.1 RluA family pseudouridine synthase [Aliarcobacter cryaerophilus]